MAFSDNPFGSGLMAEALQKIDSRIHSIDERIDSIVGNKLSSQLLEQVSEKFPTADSKSFQQVFGEIRDQLSSRANKWVVEDAIRKASTSTGVDSDLLRSVVQNESNGNSKAVSSAGAKGLMQLMDSTAQELGVLDPFDPHQNTMGGANYLKQQLQRFDGNLALALAAYNAGPTAVEKYKGVPPYAETVDYVNKVEATYKALKTQH